MNAAAISGDRAVKSQKKRKPGFFHEMHKNALLYALALPAIMYALVFKYIPIAGLTIAFQDFNPLKGLFGSRLVGFDNFKFFFRGSAWLSITINTLYLNALFIITGTVTSVILAIMITELGKGMFVKINQSLMIFPHFISFVVVAMFAQAFIGTDNGYINGLLKFLGLKPISFYMSPKIWPAVLVIIKIWKEAGYGAIIYIAAIVGIDRGIYEAARIDGASRLQVIFRITIPLLKDTVILLTILNVGKIFYGDFGMIYALVGNNSLLFSTTDIIDTYVFRSVLSSGSFGMTAAIGLYQSVIGFILVVTTNQMVRRYNPDAAIF